MMSIENRSDTVADSDSEYDRSEVIGGEKVKTTFRVVHKKVAPAIAARRKWKKFGDAKDDQDGPQLSTTTADGEVRIQFLLDRKGQPKEAEINIAGGEDIKHKSTVPGSNCRFCKIRNDHWSVHCPYKKIKDVAEGQSEVAEVAQDDPSKRSKYVAPGKKRAAAHSSTAESHKKDEKEHKIRISNLPEEEWEELEKDIRSICRGFGRVLRFSMPKSKRKENLNGIQGFAYVTFETEEQAANAIDALNGFRYFHLVLKAELATR